MVEYHNGGMVSRGYYGGGTLLTVSMLVVQELW